MEYERAIEWGHKKGGRVFKALDKAFAAPVGANRMIVFLYAMKGTPYGHVDKCMDRVVDCAELPRIAIWIFFGIDIGNSSHSQYINPAGRIVTKNWGDLPNCRPLTIAYYDTDDQKTKDRKDGEDHAAVVYDSKHLIQSGAAYDNKKRLKGKVALTEIMWHPKDKDGKFLCAKDFLSDEQHESLIVKEGTEVLIKQGMKGPLVAAVQKAFIKINYQGDMKPELISLNNELGPNTVAVIKDFQSDNGLPVTGEVDDATMALLMETQNDLADALTDSYNDLREKHDLYKTNAVGAVSDLAKKITTALDVVNREI